MPSLFDGTTRLICDALHIQDRDNLNRKTLELDPLSDETAFRLVQRLYRRIASNFPGRVRSPSKELWRCTRETEIRDDNHRPETMLEKAVAILSEHAHMPGWFNQCPVATGIVHPHDDGKRCVDLVNLSDDTLRLIELKWKSNRPAFALFEVLDYGLAYLFARLHKRHLALETQPLMQDSLDHVRLEVVAPTAFFQPDPHAGLFPRMDQALARLAEEQTDGAWSMSLRALAFPASFDAVPFDSGMAVKKKCASREGTPEGLSVRNAFDNLAPPRSHRFLPDVPAADIERILHDAPGNELLSGKFDRRTSSAALAANAFGFFLHRPADLPPLPGLEHADWPARSLALERTIHFPWRGGRHPVPDGLLDTRSALVGIECKRFEPFRGRGYAGFSDTFWRPVWGDRMGGYQRVRDLLRANRDHYAFLDAAQLVKHALALRAEVQPAKPHHGLAPILVYVYAEPHRWPDTDRRLDDDAKAHHRREIASFADLVADDEVAFVACPYRLLLEGWQSQPDMRVRAHAEAVLDRFSP